MAITTKAVTATAATATLLFTPTAASIGDETPLIVQNTDTTIIIYLGGPTVTATGTTKGIALLAGQSMPMTLLDSDSLYFFPASGTPIAVVMVGRQN